ncbi:MAG: nuclear transport factor 2 family protein [Bacteroidota bacterium]
MKKLTYLLISVFMLNPVVFAQSADEIRIAENVKTLTNAMVNADSIALKNLTAKELSYGHSTGKIENKAQFIDGVLTGPDFLSIDITEQTIQVTGKTAIIRHKFFARLIRDGKPDEARIGVMQIWTKQKSQWKLLARQAYKL